MGHHPEIFVICEKDNNLPNVSYYNGIRIMHVKTENNLNILLKIDFRINRYLLKNMFSRELYHLRSSLIIAKAVEERNKTHPFDFIQGSNYLLTTLFLQKI